MARLNAALADGVAGDGGDGGSGGGGPADGGPANGGRAGAGSADLGGRSRPGALLSLPVVVLVFVVLPCVEKRVVLASAGGRV